MLITILIVLAIIALLLFIFGRGRLTRQPRLRLEGSTPEIGWRVQDGGYGKACPPCLQPPADASRRPAIPQSGAMQRRNRKQGVELPIRRSADASRRISDQRTDALTQANVIRERRAALKRRLRDGDESLATLILDPPDYLHTARVEMLVMTTPGVGKVRSRNLLRDVGIPAKTTIGRLTERQRTMLASKLPAQRR